MAVSEQTYLSLAGDFIERELWTSAKWMIIDFVDAVLIRLKTAKP